MTAKSRRPRHRGEGINRTYPILQPSVLPVNALDRFWPIDELARQLDLQPAELKRDLDFIRDLHRRWSANPLVRPEAAGRLIREQIEVLQAGRS